MCRLLLTLTLLTVCVVTSAQEWIEHGGAEYNCTVLTGILADYGDSELSRENDRNITVDEFFALFFPSCPEGAALAQSETPTDGDSDSHEALYSFSSDIAGLQPVLGPLSLPAGIYVFTATTVGYLAVVPQSLSDDCGSDVNRSIFNLSQGQGTSGAQSVVDVEADCEILLEIGNASSGWALDIVAAAELGSSAVKGSYSTASEYLGQSPVLGPLALAKGVYVFTATTAGYMAVVPQSLSDDCGSDVDRSIFNLSQGQGAGGAQSVVEVENDCDVLLEISNTTETWQLEVKKLS